MGALGDRGVGRQRDADRAGAVDDRAGANHDIADVGGDLGVGELGRDVVALTEVHVQVAELVGELGATDDEGGVGQVGCDATLRVIGGQRAVGLDPLNPGLEVRTTGVVRVLAISEGVELVATGDQEGTGHHGVGLLEIDRLAVDAHRGDALIERQGGVVGVGHVVRQAELQEGANAFGGDVLDAIRVTLPLLFEYLDDLRTGQFGGEQGVGERKGVRGFLVGDVAAVEGRAGAAWVLDADDAVGVGAADVEEHLGDHVGHGRLGVADVGATVRGGDGRGGLTDDVEADLVGLGLGGFDDGVDLGHDRVVQVDLGEGLDDGAVGGADLAGLGVHAEFDLGQRLGVGLRLDDGCATVEGLHVLLVGVAGEDGREAVVEFGHHGVAGTFVDAGDDDVGCAAREHLFGDAVDGGGLIGEGQALDAGGGDQAGGAGGDGADDGDVKASLGDDGVLRDRSGGGTVVLHVRSKVGEVGHGDDAAGEVRPALVEFVVAHGGGVEAERVERLDRGGVIGHHGLEDGGAHVVSRGKHDDVVGSFGSADLLDLGGHRQDAGAAVRDDATVEVVEAKQCDGVGRDAGGVLLCPGRGYRAECEAAGYQGGRRERRGRALE